MGSLESASAVEAIDDIEDLHRQAILDKQSTYIDPSTGFTVFTELTHLKRGKCCGNQCRHCVYGWSNVRNSTNSSTTTTDARVRSGDKEGARRLVKRILEGTYYDDVDGHHHTTTTEQVEDNGHEKNRNQTCNSTNVNRCATGGSAGGKLTSKNVPYTRKGDTGTSQLFTGERRSKDDVLFEALGTVDELCTVVGVVYAELNASIEKHMAENDTQAKNNSTLYADLPEQLLDVMSRLFDVGSHIATPQYQQNKESTKEKKRNNEFHSHHSSLLEEWIDTMTEELPELTSFILPTGSTASAQLHVARTVCRRAERRMVPLVQPEEGTVDPAALAYVNRLSDYFFTAARFVNYCEDRDEVQYRREERGPDETGKKGANFQRERVVVKLKK